MNGQSVENMTVSKHACKIQFTINIVVVLIKNNHDKELSTPVGVLQ